jgi:hypothetical protein
MTIRDLEDCTMKIKTNKEKIESLHSLLLSGVIDNKIYKYLKFRCVDLGRDKNNRYCLEKDVVWK